MPTILVADDSLSVRKVAERQLTEAGFDVALASNGEEAMTWLSTKRPDLVIADVIMPDKSGFEVCAYVRSNAALADTPVILVSGFVDDEVTKQAEACRADGIVKKPFQGSALKERVLELLSARKAAQAPPEPEPALEPTLEAPALSLEVEMPAGEAPSAAAQAEPALAPVTPSEDLLQELRESTASAIQGLEARFAEQARAFGQLEEQLQALKEGTDRSRTDLETGLTGQQQRAADLEQKVQGFRESLAKAVAQVQDLESRLADAERLNAELQKRLAELEPAAASAEKLAHLIADFARQAVQIVNRQGS